MAHVDVPYFQPKAALPIMIIGDFPSVQDVTRKKPLTGRENGILTQWLSAVGIERARVPHLLVFRQRPATDKVGYFFQPTMPLGTKLSAFKNQYVQPDYARDVQWLRRTLVVERPEAVITLGALALWAVMNQDNAVDRFGDRADHWCTVESGKETVRFTLFPAYHPGDIQEHADRLSFNQRAFKAAAKYIRPAMY